MAPEHTHPDLGEIDDASTWDEIADWYVDNHGDHATNYIAVEQAALQPGDIVLDIGCGGGAAARAAASRLTAGRVFAIDPAPAMIKRAVRDTIGHPRRHQVTYGAGDAAEIPLEDSFVSVALAINSIHHWPDPDGGLDEVKRVLKPGGRIVVVEEWLDGKLGHGDGPLSAPGAIEKLLTDNGFADVESGRQTKDDTEAVVVTATYPA